MGWVGGDGTNGVGVWRAWSTEATLLGLPEPVIGVLYEEAKPVK